MDGLLERDASLPFGPILSKLDVPRLELYFDECPVFEDDLIAEIEMYLKEKDPFGYFSQNY